MSEHAHAPGGHPPAETDRIYPARIVLVGAAALLIFAAASAVTVLYMRRAQAELNPAFPVMPAAAGEAKIGIVEQQLFENADRAKTLRVEEERRLHSYGWVDRKAGLAHLPIDRAMDLVLQGERP